MSITSQKANSILPANNNAQNQVQFDLSIFEVVDQKVNLTKMANNFGKEIRRWLQNPTTKKFISSLEADDGKSVIAISKGGNGEQGTFGTREVALKVAQWISPDFEVFCIKKLDTLFQTGKVELNPVAPSQPIFSLAQLLEQNNFYIKSLSEENVELKIEVNDKNSIITDLSPKAQFVDEVLIKGNTGLSGMSIVAKEIGLGPVKLYKLLRNKGVWFYALNEHGINENIVNQNYIDNDCFVIKQFFSERDRRTYDKIFATNKGKLLCHKLAKEEIATPQFEIKLT